MANLVKIVGEMLEKPTDMLFGQVEIVLHSFGYERKSTSGGSHFVYRKRGCPPITIPKKSKKVKRCYIVRIVDILNLEEWYEKRIR